jgi:hypothetical protein
LAALEGAVNGIFCNQGLTGAGWGSNQNVAVSVERFGRLLLEPGEGISLELAWVASWHSVIVGGIECLVKVEL